MIISTNYSKNIFSKLFIFNIFLFLCLPLCSQVDVVNAIVDMQNVQQKQNTENKKKSAKISIQNKNPVSIYPKEENKCSTGKEDIKAKSTVNTTTNLLKETDTTSNNNNAKKEDENEILTSQIDREILNPNNKYNLSTQAPTKDISNDAISPNNVKKGDEKEITTSQIYEEILKPNKVPENVPTANRHNLPTEMPLKDISNATTPCSLSQQEISKSVNLQPRRSVELKIVTTTFVPTS